MVAEAEHLLAVEELLAGEVALAREAVLAEQAPLGLSTLESRAAELVSLVQEVPALEPQAERAVLVEAEAAHQALALAVEEETELSISITNLKFTEESYHDID